MVFVKGRKGIPSTGAVAAVRRHIAAHPFLIEITDKDVLKVLTDAEIPNASQKMASNTVTSLRLTKTIVATGEKKGKFHIYKVIRDGAPAEIPADKTEEMLATAEVADKTEQPEETAQQEPEEDLEDQLLAEMQKVEDLQAQVDAQAFRIQQLEKGLALDYETLGKSVFTAHENLKRSFLELESSTREELSKLGKLRTEDRNMIGSYQKKIRDLELENRAMRARLQHSASNEKPDMSVFNSPRIKGGA